MTFFPPKPKPVLLLVLFLTFCLDTFGQFTSNLKSREKENETLKHFCAENETVVKELFSEINLQLVGLELVREAVSRNDYSRACIALLDYYQAKSIRRNWTTNPRTGVSQVALDALDLKFTFQGVSDQLPHLGNNLSWLHKGPKNDVEWSYFLNRMWYLDSLQCAYRSTGDTRFAKTFNELITDWIYANPAPMDNANDPAWRVLEAGLRMAGPWPKAFFGFQQAKDFRPVTRILMLMSIVDHGRYLQKYHWTHHNHGVMELNGLMNLALTFPEFKSAQGWYAHAMEAMAEEFRYQSYPDGAMKELTSSYQWVVIRHFNEFICLNELNNKQLPDEFYRTVESMCNYMAYTSRPDGKGLLNNDADLLNNFTLLAPYVLKYQREDWKYILSSGKDGLRPVATSVMFPWAGHFIMRNGWGESIEKGDFAYFDAGPWGTSHQHNDKLHLSIYSGDRELLCDAGRMYYKVDKWRRFFNLSASHNVILVDGKGQDEADPETKSEIESGSYSIQDEADFCIASYNGGFNDISRHVENSAIPTTKAKHTRAVLYLKGKYWIVVDNIKSDQPRFLTALWHFNPDCSVSANGSVVFTNDSGKTNLSIKALSMLDWSVHLVKGQEDPVIQGWYSEKYNNRVPAYCAEYKTRMPTNEVTFAWLLTPARDTLAIHPEVEILSSPAGTMHFRINAGTEGWTEVAIDLSGKERMKLSDGNVLEGHCAVRTANKTLMLTGKIIND
jgi:hypothetical protein